METENLKGNCVLMVLVLITFLLEGSYQSVGYYLLINNADSLSALILSRPSGMNTVKQDGCDVMHNFKALPLNKKVIHV